MSKDFLANGYRDDVIDYLTNIYKGVFTREAIDNHFENHVGDGFSDYTTAVLSQHLIKGSRILDVGSGFGSCVLSARNAGFDAFGVELSAFEVDFAKKRLESLRPNDNAEAVYHCGDARDFKIKESLDAVTFWNVIEHIENWDDVLKSALEYLKPGGMVFILCPNYMAWRDEAHYHVPWKPSFLMSKAEGSKYLKSLGKSTAYFDECIFYRTNFEVIRKLKSSGLDLYQLGNAAPRDLSLKNMKYFLRNPIQCLNFYNPFKCSVEIAARKV